MSEEKRGTFLVTETDAESAVLVDVRDGQVHPLSSNPGFDVGDVVEGTVAPEPPLEVTWSVDVGERRSIAIESMSEPPEESAREGARSLSEGEMTRREVEDGELHVLVVPEGRTEAAVADVVEDEATRRRAARLGADRVEVRGEDGVVSVRYLG